jgi:hypothetical protein
MCRLGMEQKLVEPATRLLLLWTFDGAQRVIRTMGSATRTAGRAEIVNARLTCHSRRCWWAQVGERIENAEGDFLRLVLASFVIHPAASTWAGL